MRFLHTTDKTVSNYLIQSTHVNFMCRWSLKNGAKTPQICNLCGSFWMILLNKISHGFIFLIHTT